MRKKIFDLILNYSPEYGTWLGEREKNLNEEFSFKTFYLSFSMASRVKGGEAIFTAEIPVDPDKKVSMVGWQISRLGRIYLILSLADYDQEKFETAFRKLFETAELNELVALYSSLVFLPNPDKYVERAAEGVRTNIGPVLEAIAIRNPFPARYFSEIQWNQLILKMVFTDKPFYEIIGIDERANETLAVMLINYAKERWAAGRVVTPELWRPVGKFLTEDDVWLLERMLNDDQPLELEATVLACHDSKSQKMNGILKNYPEINNRIIDNTLNWNILGKKYWKSKTAGK